MAYSSDFRKCVLGFIEAGGQKTQACRQFSIARATLYTWLNAEDALVRQKPRDREPLTSRHLKNMSSTSRIRLRQLSRSFAFTMA